jgi:hypothetical protein
MTKTQSIIVALIGAVYLCVATHFDNNLSLVLSFLAGVHICAAFTIKE